ncbi:unnamed protein product, partial [Ectocarpus sp. 4 AP-2014]
MANRPFLLCQGWLNNVSPVAYSKRGGDPLRAWYRRGDGFRPFNIHPARAQHPLPLLGFLFQGYVRFVPISVSVHPHAVSGLSIYCISIYSVDLFFFIASIVTSFPSTHTYLSNRLLLFSVIACVFTSLPASPPTVPSTRRPFFFFLLVVKTTV